MDVSLYFDYCPFTSDDPEALSEHKKSSHVTPVEVSSEPRRRSEIPCKLCPFKAPTIRELKKHVTDLHSQKTSRTQALFKFSCDNCDFRTYGMYEMFTHTQDWHKGQALEGNFTPEVKVKCFECSLHFLN